MTLAGTRGDTGSPAWTRDDMGSLAGTRGDTEVVGSEDSGSTTRTVTQGRSRVFRGSK